jgi:hypothetical protein
MTIMTTHSSVTTREEEPHVNQTTRTATIIDALKRRAQTVLNDSSINAQSRAVIRQAMETNDPWLAQLIKRAESGERIADTADAPTSEINEADPRRKKIEALAEIICGGGDQSAAALLVLMGTLEHSTHPKVLAHTAKHFAFTRCGELNFNGMVDAHIAMLEGELLAGDTVQF